MTPTEITRELAARDTGNTRRVVVTGGEPALQWDDDLATVIAEAGFRVHMETNGTRALAAPVDWLTVSPKPQFHPAHIALVAGDDLEPDECKVVVDDAVDQDALRRFESAYSCDHWFLQPCDDRRAEHHLRRTLELVAARPRWRLSLQLHKIIGLP